MEQHVERMLNEHVELCKKILNLGDFIIDNNIFKTLSEDEKYDMKLQYDAMTMYSDILHHRIEREIAHTKTQSNETNKDWGLLHL